MTQVQLTMAQRVAKAVRAHQQQRTGHEPQEVTVMLDGNTLVITLNGALTPAEQALAASPEGAAKVQEFHRQLFASSSQELLAEIRRITGISVREAALEVDSGTGAIVHAFTRGTVVQVFQLAQPVSALDWNGTQ